MIGASLELESLTFRYRRGEAAAVSGLSLKAEPGELVALLGPSGCGKTTALKMVAGLLAPTSGDVLVGGASVIGLAPEKREAAMVFQKPLLFPNMSVRENVGFGLRMRGRTDAAEARVLEALARVQMSGFADRNPRELSGGEQQRISLARALVTEPKLLLLDEPLSALDANLREEMRGLVLQLQEEGGYTTVFVTHDQEEAVILADRIALLDGGELLMYDTPEAFYDRPKTRRVARFFGATNFIEGDADGPLLVSTGLGPLKLRHPAPPGPATLTIRPESVLLGVGAGENSFPARITGATYLGTQVHYDLEAGGLKLRAATAPSVRFTVGARVETKLPAASLWPLSG
ncbi:ABC transporter ATP-binding protein [Rubrobacter indicoceani]|uniref:ABC transporter ATP-binding protein n=1 Tax=Rubrobacter indicoceani TaxID=2051957 RepID=UPI000E5ACFDD|nr:ABC transporter ATP-binding protein [Rubrobacter indicoceani]